MNNRVEFHNVSDKSLNWRRPKQSQKGAHDNWQWGTDSCAATSEAHDDEKIVQRLV